MLRSEYCLARAERLRMLMLTASDPPSADRLRGWWRSMPPIIRRSGPAPCRRSNIAATPPSRTSSVLWWSAKAALILQDDIKGNALDLLWPDHITAAELFPLLTPTADNYFGSYALFQMTLPDTRQSACPLQRQLS